MTCREKLAMERPEKVHITYVGGCAGCPHDYGYNVERPDYCRAPDGDFEIRCARCWDREIPGTEKQWLKENSHISDEAKEVMEEHRAHILDSGNRREFGTGAVRDIQEGKGRCDLVPLDVVAKYLNDDILQCIAMFQLTGSTDPLYEALWKFSPHWDDGYVKGSDKSIMAQRNSTMLLEVSKHYEEGCIKYGERNWQKGIPVRCYIDSAVRHYLKFIRGDKDEPHDRAFCWNILGAIWTCVHKPELCEYPVKLEVEG